MTYKLQFDENATENQKIQAQRASQELLERFEPLFKKYFTLIRTGHIDFSDKEMKRFVYGFIGDATLKAALKRPHATSEFCSAISKAFNFVVETYAKNEDVDIITDLQMCFFILAKRYKQIGYNFCAYLYNVYNFEVSRHIKKYIKNPANIPYRQMEYEDYMQTYHENDYDNCIEDQFFENSQGIPDETWISGESCSDIFQCLTPEERKFVIKYYLEDFNDRQIAEQFGMYINSVNQKRRRAVIKLAEHMGVDIRKIQRSRKSGKNALIVE